MQISYYNSSSSNPYDKFVVGSVETKDKEIPEGMHELSFEELHSLIDHVKQIESKPPESSSRWSKSLADETLGYVATQVVFGSKFSTVLKAMERSLEENGINGVRIYGCIGKSDFEFKKG